MRAWGQEICYKPAGAARGVPLRASGDLGGRRRLAGERLDNRLDQSAWEEAEQDRPGGGDQ